jgi:ubiquinone/menaquinone biosynthesis C-methylase UbiE
VLSLLLCQGAGVSEMWNGVAASWEQAADFVDDHGAVATEAMLDAAAVGTGSEVLDLACGPGGAGLAAARRVGTTGRVVLADVATAMVQIAGKRSSGLPQVSTLVCDQTSIDATDESFDAVLCRHGLMFVEDPRAAVVEAVRTLRPGGRYAALTWGAREANPWLGLLLDAVGAQFGTTFPPSGVPGPFSLDDHERLEETLRAGGLEGVRVDQLSMPMTLPSLQAWWDQVQGLAGPLALLLAGVDPAVRDAIRLRAFAFAESAVTSSSSGVRFEGVALLASGQRR